MLCLKINHYRITYHVRLICEVDEYEYKTLKMCVSRFYLFKQNNVDYWFVVIL